MEIKTFTASQVPEALLENTIRGLRKPQYDQLAEALLNCKPGEWVRVLILDMPKSKSGGNKRLQGNVIEALKTRKIGKVKTRILGAHLWITVVREPVEKSKQLGDVFHARLRAILHCMGSHGGRQPEARMIAVLVCWKCRACAGPR